MDWKSSNSCYTTDIRSAWIGGQRGSADSCELFVRLKSHWTLLLSMWSRGNGFPTWWARIIGSADGQPRVFGRMVGCDHQPYFLLFLLHQSRIPQRAGEYRCRRWISLPVTAWKARLKVWREIRLCAVQHGGLVGSRRRRGDGGGLEA